MNKKILIIIIVAVLIVALGAGGYFYWNKKNKTLGEKALEAAGDAAEKLTESVTKGILPSIQTNLFENKPNINPADKANPFKNIKINPFE